MINGYYPLTFFFLPGLKCIDRLFYRCSNNKYHSPKILFISLFDPMVYHLRNILELVDNKDIQFQPLRQILK